MTDPLHQFEIHRLVPLDWAGYDISFTNSALYMVIVLMVVSGFFLWATRKSSVVPGRLQAVAELSYNFIAQMIQDNVGSEGRPFFPFVFSLFLFILMGNMVGMIPYSFTFTSHIIVTFGLAMIVFLAVTIIGFVCHGAHFLTLFFPKGAPLFMAPLIIPIELLSYLSRPVSLSVRLFANMMAGHTMLKVFAGFTISLGLIGAGPLVINAALTGFEILVAFLQAYVFTILTCLYLNDALHLH